MLRRLIVGALLALCAVALSAQVILPQYTVADSPACASGESFVIEIVDASSSSTCTSGGGSNFVTCVCEDGTYLALGSGGGGGGNSFETINAPSGTDPVADSSTDTLNVTCTAPLVCAGDSSTDTLDFTIDSATVSRCARFDGSGLLVAALADCSAGDLNSPVALGLDVGGSHSSALTKIEIDNNVDRLFASEPSADVLRLDATAAIDRWLSPGPSSLGTIGCEFNASLCNFTVVSGTASCAGTVSTTANSAGTEVCDLSTHPDELLIQAGNGTADDVLLRVDATLANNNGIVWKMSGASQGTGNSNQCGVGLNDNDTSPQSGNWTEIIFDAQANLGQRVIFQASAGTVGPGALADDSYSHAWGAFLRIDDGGNQVYWAFVSVNGGTTWHYLGRQTTTATHDNVWIFCDTRTAFTSSTPAIPVTSFHYIYPVAGTNLYDPF